MHSFIVLSAPGPVAREATLIHALFAAGMTLFHIRKPGYSEKEVQQLLTQIDPEYYERIALHQHHQVAKLAGIKRLHFPERIRLQQQEQTLQDLKAGDYTLSTSIHDQDSYHRLSGAFAYTFFGPYAPSISKPGYVGTAETKGITGIIKQGTALIALGGLQASNLREPISTGFDGVAVLGSVWKDEKVTDNFKQLQKIWLTADPVY